MSRPEFLEIDDDCKASWINMTNTHTRSKMKKPRLAIFFVPLLMLGVFVLVSSCVPNKKILYLQDPAGQIPTDSLLPLSYLEYRFKSGDQIRVEVRAMDNSVTEVFRSRDDNSFTTHVVSEEGEIELPLVGLLNIKGKTLEESKLLIESSLTKYIIDPFVVVKFGGIRYIAIGEFNTPGSYTVLQGKMTIFEAIANAGDLTNIADRSKLTLIRQYSKGQMIHIIDLTDRSLINSPFYYVMPGDQLYAEPLKVREVRTALSVVSDLGGILAGLSAVALIFILTK